MSAKTKNNETLPSPPPGKRLRRPGIPRLYGRSLAIMGRELEHIATLVRKAKLDGSDARDLARYIRLLADLEKLEDLVDKRVKEKMGKMTIEQLEAHARQLLEKRQSKPKGKK